ncbi:MAG: ABC transporter substrate-binding protein [Candidatus Paceibacterota bacterium]
MESLSRKYDEFGKALAPKSKAGKKIYDFFGYFSLKERLAFYVLLLIFLMSFGLLVKKLNDMITVEVPLFGGTLREGIVGIPRFSNPVLASSDVDKDVASLIYSGLMRVGSEGKLIPDLAENYSVSPDGLTYTFVLKKNLVFHDGSKLSSADVAYTINQVKNPIFKSPRGAAWSGINIETPDDLTVVFHLKSPYALFLESTTLGILPKSLWKKTNDETFPYNELNLAGVGSGPYKVVNVAKNKDSVPTVLTLTAFNSFTLAKPYIKNIKLYFYANEEARSAAYGAGYIDTLSGITAEDVGALNTGKGHIVSFYLPRIFAVFFNQNQESAFTYREVRAALDASLDKEAITRTVLHDYGNAINGTIPPGSFGYASSTNPIKDQPARIASAQALLQQNGWNKVGGVYQKKFTGDPKKKSSSTVVSLAFSISTADTPELKRTAELIRDTWNSLGAKVELKVYEIGDLNQNVIRPRNFDALFFGEIVGRNPDPFFYWHSSERADPGLNIAMYANPAVDKLVDSIRASASDSDRLDKLRKLDTAIKRDQPASFIYAPQYIYLINNRVRGVTPMSLTTPNERFSNIYTWYIDTERVWKIFTKQN